MVKPIKQSRCRVSPQPVGVLRYDPCWALLGLTAPSRNHQQGSSQSHSPSPSVSLWLSSSHLWENVGIKWSNMILISMRNIIVENLEFHYSSDDTYWLTSWAYFPRPLSTLWWSSSKVMSPEKKRADYIKQIFRFFVIVYCCDDILILLLMTSMFCCHRFVKKKTTQTFITF